MISNDNPARAPDAGAAPNEDVKNLGLESNQERSFGDSTAATSLRALRH